MSSQDDTPVELRELLKQQLREAQHQNQQSRHLHHEGSLIQVPGIGQAVTNAYEQLRNAAEYTEEHLLLQRAIRRFFRRTILVLGHKHQVPQNIGEELIVELTQAGYLQNGNFGSHVAAMIYSRATQTIELYWTLHSRHVPREEALGWTVDILAVELEGMLNPHAQLDAIAYTAYVHYSRLLPKEVFIAGDESENQYEICLYIAMHQALFKSDTAYIRYELSRMHDQQSQDIEQFVTFHRRITPLFTSRLTEDLKRTIGKYGAPLRILKSLSDTHSELADMLDDRPLFLSLYEKEIGKEYKELSRRLGKGIAKSIAFIFITKILIGVGIEIPYDLVIIGHIVAMPLTINLLFPPLYMASLEFGLRTPSRSNAIALKNYIDQTLFGTSTTPFSPKISRGSPSVSIKLLYGITFFIPFIITVYVLSLLHFNVVQTVIFFVFLSTASFLGFRLARMIRDLEILTEQRNFLATLRDFFYLPFILVGQWLSRNYAKANAIAYFLDMAIELPLKTILRLTRQWSRFLSEKHDQIY